MMKTTAVAAGVLAVLYCSQSVAAAPKSSDAKSSGKPTVSAVEGDFLNERKAAFAAQDKLLKKADALAKNGKLLDAIKHYKNVKFELSLEDSERDSWVVKRRFNEVSARLREMELAYGNMKLAEAEKALEERRYNVAISLVNDAIQVCQELLPRGNRIKTLAVSRQKSDELKKDISPDSVVPELKSKEAAVRKFIAEAKVLMKYRQYEDARRRVEEDQVRNAFDSIEFCRLTTAVIDLVPVHSELGSSLDGHIHRLALPYCDAHHIELISFILVIYRLDIRHLPAAWTAPWRPEIKQYIFAFAHIVRQLYLRVFRLRRHAAGLPYYCIHRKVYKRLALGCSDPCVKAFLQSSYIFSFKHFCRHLRDYCTCLLIIDEAAKVHKHLHRHFVVRILLGSIEIELYISLDKVIVERLCLLPVCRK